LQNANAQPKHQPYSPAKSRTARVEAALTEADRHKNEFIAILAHELRIRWHRSTHCISATRKSAQIAAAHDMVERQAAPVPRR
jgi:hypothetical protein